MNNIVIFKTTDYMQDRIDLTNMTEKLVTQTFTLACSLYQAGNIDKLHLGRNFIFCFDQVGEFVQANIRYRHYADIWFDGAERVVFRINCRCCQGVENG